MLFDIKRNFQQAGGGGGGTGDGKLPIGSIGSFGSFETSLNPRFGLFEVCAFAPCSPVLKYGSHTEFLCELMDNTDLGFPTKDRRQCGSASCGTRFLFGDVGAQGGVDENGDGSISSSERQPIRDAIRQAGVKHPIEGVGTPFFIGLHGNDDTLASWSAPDSSQLLPPKVVTTAACGLTLDLPDANADGELDPPTVDGPWSPGPPYNGMGPLNTIGPAFSVSDGSTTKFFAFYPNPDDPLFSGVVAGAQPIGGIATCEVTADCRTHFTPFDTCVDGLCRIGSCQSTDPCIPRWRGGRLLRATGTTVHPESFVTAGSQDVHEELRRALSGKLDENLDPGEIPNPGTPFSLPTFLVEDYEGTPGVWVFGRPQWGGPHGHEAANVYLMRANFVDGKLQAPQYFNHCEFSQSPQASCFEGATPVFQTRSAGTDVPVGAILNDEHPQMFFQWAVTKVNGIGPNGDPIYVMLYGGRPPPFAVTTESMNGLPAGSETFPQFSAELFADPYETGIHMRVSRHPWGPWSPASLVYNAQSPATPGYCDLMYWNPNDEEVPASLWAPNSFLNENEQTFCGRIASARGIPRDTLVRRNKLMRNRGPAGAFSQYDHGEEYGVGVVEDLTESAEPDGFENAAWIYWTMSTFVPYRVVMMRTAVTADALPSRLLTFQLARTDLGGIIYRQFLEGTRLGVGCTPNGCCVDGCPCFAGAGCP